MVERFAAAVREVADHVERELAGRKAVPHPIPAADAQ
jgi:hypothetical protein